MIEIEGTKTAWYDSPNARIHYIVHGYGAKTPQECFNAYINWYESLKDYKAIVWRRRAEIDKIGDSYKITWRCALIQETDPLDIAHVKQEGLPVYMKEYK